MPNLLNASGLTTATRAELVSFYTAAYQSIYGSDIILTSDSPDGQLMNIFIQSVLDLQDLLTQVYNSFDPDNAIGVILDQRVAINGIQRQAGTFTITNVTIVNSQSVNLYGLDQSAQPVFTVSDNAGNKFELITTQLGVGAGTNVFSFQAAVPGAVLTVPNTITVPVTIVLGVTSINNPTTYTTLGVNEESDLALKVRRQKSVSLSSQGYLQGLLAALENIPGVTAAQVYENTTNATDSNGIPGHSIWVVVSGTPTIVTEPAWSSVSTYAYGDIVSYSGLNYISWVNGNLNNIPGATPADWGVFSPIAQAIYAKRNAGCGMFGSTNYTIKQIDASFFIISWDTVVATPLFIQFTATSLNGVTPPNISAIKQGLISNFIPGVAAEVNINQLATAVQAIDPNTLVTSAGFSLTTSGFTTTLTPTALNKQFTVSTANTIVLTMIMSAPGVTYTIAAGVVTHTNVSIASGGTTLQFTPLGGYGTFPGTMVFSKDSGAGAINSSTGLYTSAGAGTDVVRVTDALGNFATCTITVV